ncbi:MAG: hypothetical protein LBI28_00270 [Treponema sp.]|jgi:hypothetical protein|nr:hypothetical protein [Treponema sp.]
MMLNLRKIAVFITLFAGITSLSFADTLYSISTSLTRLSEQYPDENYGRDLDGISLNMMLNHYNGNSPLGWFIRTSVGGVTTGYEWTETDTTSVSVYSSTDIKISVGPSFRIRAGSLIQIPISIGPVFSNYREEENGYWAMDYDYTLPGSYGSSGYYEAFNLGVLGDAAIVINPFTWLTIINGITVSWDFMRWEKGYNNSSLISRNTSGQFKSVNYSAFTVGLYFGIGIRFGDTNSQ